jgi:PAS domain S-box-containing protein
MSSPPPTRPHPSKRPDEQADFFDRPGNSILHAAHEAIVMIDERQQIVAVNAAAEQAFRCAAGELLGRPLAQLVPLAQRDSHAASVQEYVGSPPMQQRLGAHRRVTARRPDGSHFPAEITLSTVDMAGTGTQQRYFAALILDLSEQGRLQQELDHFKRRMRSVFELAPVAIWIADNDHIAFANQAAERLFGDHGSLVGRPLYELLAEATRAGLRTQVKRALVGDADVPVVHGHVVRPDGSQREVEIALAALPDHGRTTVQLVVADVTQQRREAAELAASREALRKLSTNVVEAREEERRPIARELHDELGQRLTALKMELAALRAASPGRDGQIDNMLGMVDETLASVRRISTDLRPMMLDDLGLNAAVEWLARDAARRLGIEVTVRLGENEPPLDDRVATAAFRMVQEALTNVARHARATDVQIELRQHDGELELTVRDNGVGFPDDALRREGSFGLVGMRERASMLGGRVELGNPEGGGARLIVHLPLAPDEEGST